MKNSAVKGNADTISPSQVSYAGKFKVISTDKSDGVVMDTARPASYPQIGPSSKTGFGKDND